MSRVAILSVFVALFAVAVAGEITPGNEALTKLPETASASGRSLLMVNPDNSSTYDVVRQIPIQVAFDADKAMDTVTDLGEISAALGLWVQNLTQIRTISNLTSPADYVVRMVLDSDIRDELGIPDIPLPFRRQRALASIFDDVKEFFGGNTQGYLTGDLSMYFQPALAAAQIDDAERDMRAAVTSTESRDMVNSIAGVTDVGIGNGGLQLALSRALLALALLAAFLTLA